MCRKLIYLISFVVLLSAASSVQAITTVTTAYGNGADTYVTNDGQTGTGGSNGAPTATHGTETGVTHRRYDGTRMKLPYIRFDTNDVIGDLNDATLSFNFTGSNRARTWNIYGLVNETGDSWPEATTSYSNAPGFDPCDLGYYRINANLQSVGTWDVTATIGIQTSLPGSLLLRNFIVTYDTNKRVTLAVIAQGTDNNAVWYITSKEANPALAPTLTFPYALSTKASYPNPANASVVSQQNVTLMWQAGAYADKHDVYLGTDSAAVADANSSDITGIYQGQYDPNYYDATGLVSGKTYYWRIDEVNATKPPGLWRGPIWSFSIPNITAYDPIPTDGFNYVAPKMILRWTKGLGAATHDVYVGTDETRVTDANNTPGVWPEFKGNQPGATYDPPGALSYDTTYYWRIDEVNTATFKGDVWDFTTVYAPVEPNLICLWKFDGDANDSSYGCDGTPYASTESNEPGYVDGMNGSAIYFLGTTGPAPNQYVDLPINSVISTLTNSTFMAWVYRLPTTGQKWHRIFDFGTGTTNSMALLQWRSSSPPTHFEINSGGVTERVTWGPYDNTGTTIPSDEWHHLAVTFNDDTNTLTLYVDGEVPADGGELINTTLNPSDLGYTTQNWLARAQGWSGSGDPALFRGYVDELRIYDRALSAAEIEDAMTPQKAWWPTPRNNATGVARKPTLSWKVGLDANSVKGHRVYFDPNQQKVIDRSPECDVNGVSTTNPTYAITTLLEPMWTYYWAVDEVNSNDPCSPWPGEVWRFTTRDFLVVEDFNSYANDTALKAVWKKSNAAIMLAEDPNRSGRSMNYSYYSYNSPYYAEVNAVTTALPSGIGKDWTIGDVEALVLYFYGDPINDANEQMYVKLTDGTNTKSVMYDGDMNDIKESVWHEWNIDLDNFAPVNLSNVTGITLRFGDGVEGTGEVSVFFEDILLYPRRCVLSKRTPDYAKADYIPTGYPSGNCDVNYQELGTMVSNWLDTAELIRIEAEDADMNDPNAWNVLSDRADASGEYIVVATGYSAPNEPNVSNLATYDFTVNGGVYKIFGRVVAASATQDSFWCRIPDATLNVTVPNNWLRWDVSEAAGNAWVWDEINSDANGDVTVQFTMSAGQHTLQMGYREQTLLDLLVITDDLGLTEADLLAWDADLNGDNMIDLKDFALLAKQWLKEELWP